MKRSVYAMIGGLAVACSAVAQEAKPPALLVKGDDGSSSPLRVDEVEVRVKVVGNVAETVMTMRFRNDTDRVLEGELVFPLGEGRTVSRYALEVNGAMREGVSIPKQRGRAVFESVVRQQIDPGLVEWTKGNNFRTRVYPIPAKGTKAVRVGYEEELAEARGEYLYRLPLDFEDPVKRFHLKVEVARPAEEIGEVQVEGGLKVKRRGTKGWIVEAEEKDYAANEPLVVRIPREKAPTALVERRNSERFFYVVDRPGVPEIRKERAKPTLMQLVWDASNSGAKREVEKELALLDRFFKWMGDGTVELHWLRNEVERGGTFEIKSGAWGELKKELEAVRYDGGTRLSELDFRKMEGEAVVLVSDGVSTLGKSELKVGKVPVLAVHAAQAAEHGVLRGVAVKSGGVYVNLAAATVEEGLALLTEEQFSLMRAEVVDRGGDAGEEIYPSMAQRVRGAVGVAGKLKSDRPVTVVLRYGWGGEETMVRRIELDPVRHLSRLDRVPRLWAQKKLAELETDAKSHRGEIVELARDHGLVTRFTSLIVLDRIEDYVEHRIVPPEPEMRDQYERMLKEAPDPAAPNPEHLKEMLTLWKERCDWHAAKFPGLEEVIFERLEELEPAMNGLREELKEVTGLKEEEKKAVERVRDLAGQFEEIRRRANGLQDTAGVARDEKWKRAAAEVVKEAQVLFGKMDEFNMMAEEGDAADPFGGTGGLGVGRPAVRLRLPTGGEGERDVLRAPAAFPVTPATPSNGEDYEPPELPNQVGGNLGGVAAEELDGFAALSVAAAAALAKGGDERGGESGITLAEWDPETPYLAALKKARDDAEAEAVYFAWKTKQSNSSAFYLDVADYFRERKQEQLALRILTNVAEMNLESVPLLRILGHRLDQLGELELAEMVFREVKDLRGDEPQSWRDLALVLEKRGNHQEALDLMWMVVSNEWDGRFPAIQMVVLGELNALVARKGAALDLSAVDERFLKNLDCDLRIVMTWDADNTDIDLWVDGPAGERCYYSHPRTRTGGWMSEDFTSGYGPEEFLIRRALEGDYRVRANFYGNRQQVLAGATTVQVVFITNWGRSNEKREAVTLRLKDEQEVVKVGRTSFGER